MSNVSDDGSRSKRRANKKRRRRRPRLSGWKLVAAEAVVGLATTSTLLITHDPGAATVVATPLLLVLGVSAI
jgi:hypothetical protein